MNLTSPSQVKSWCIENGFHPNKTLGQNFLIDRNVLEAIVTAGLDGAASGESVLEIGPGLGVMTEEMLSRGMQVVAIEKDAALAERLQREAWPRLQVVTGDALDPAVMARAREMAAQPFVRMVSNLPYQAGTRILLELVQRRELESMTVLLQTEVAERLAAPPGGKTRSLAGVWAQLDYDVEIVRKVSAACFWPRPEIGSAVVRLRRHDRNVGLSDEERRIFHSLTKKAFEHRRKQLASIFKDLIKSTLRAEALSNSDWIDLVKGFAQNENT